MKIDTRTPSIPLQRQVWRLFPGDSYAFLQDFIKQGVGFLDYPTLELPSANELRFFSEEKLKQLIISSIEKKEEILFSKQYEKFELIDENTKSRRWSENRARGLKALMNFMVWAKKGDLIILPEPKQMSQVWVGEFSDEQIIYATSEAQYGKVSIPARQVRWIKQHSENTLSNALSSSLRHQHPFTILEKSLYLECFSLAYDSYVYGDRKSTTIFNDDEFLDLDASLLANITKIAARACQIVDQELYSEYKDKGSLLDILISNPPSDYSCDQASDIHSKGFTRYTSSRDVPLVLSALFASLLLLSSCTSKSEMQTKIETITYVNSSGSTDPQCDARVSRASKLALEMIDIDTTWALCAASRSTKSRHVRPSASLVGE